MGKLGSNSVSFTIDKNVAPYLEESILQALEMIGLKAESYAKVEITNNGSVDTGLLRNSIAHAAAGEQPSIGANYRGTSKKQGLTRRINLTKMELFSKGLTQVTPLKEKESIKYTLAQMSTTLLTSN